MWGQWEGGCTGVWTSALCGRGLPQVGQVEATTVTCPAGMVQVGGGIAVWSVGGGSAVWGGWCTVTCRPAPKGNTSAYWGMGWGAHRAQRHAARGMYVLFVGLERNLTSFI